MLAEHKQPRHYGLYSLLTRKGKFHIFRPTKSELLQFLGMLPEDWHDIRNLHVYPYWGYLRTDTQSIPQEEFVRNFRNQTEKHPEEGKSSCISEIGWFDSASLTGSIYEFYRKDPGSPNREEIKPSYTGKEIIENPLV